MSKFGHFQGDGREFVFTDYKTMRPMLNYMWNASFLSGINHFGGGDGAYGGRAACYIDGQGKGRCSIIRNGLRYFYVKDEQTGKVWNPGWFPVQESLDFYECVHGLGYTKVTGEKDGVRLTATVFVGEQEPCEIWMLNLENKSGVDKDIKVYFAAEFSLEGYARYSDYMSYVTGVNDESRNLIVCFNKAQERPHDWFNAFMASDRKIDGFETSKKAFLGTYGDMKNPEAIANGKLSNSLAACEFMLGALENDFSLKAGESVQYNCVLGGTDSLKTAQEIVDRLFVEGEIEKQYKALMTSKTALIEDNYVKTPDEKVNNIVNSWLKQQVQLCAEAGRDTGKGFRDQLQDAWASASFNASLAKDKIYETLTKEYSDGRCPRGWLPLDHHIYSDGPTWIAPTINAYLKETGDYAFLDEKVPYLDEGEDTVWEHILTAVRFSSEDLGPHNLVKARDGDWNDSLNLIGIGGKGESVWTSISLYFSLCNAAEIARVVKKDLVVEKELLERAERIKKAVNENGWDKDWYLAAINDNGDKVGTHTETEGRIYLNSQTWAVMSGVAEGERVQKCLDAVDNLLMSKCGPMTLAPAYKTYNGNIGRLTGFVPGIWENGTPYCHGGTFKIVADCCAGRGNIAYDTMLKILPDSTDNPSDYSGCEPYALTNMYFGPENPRAGQTMFAWVTGTAGWMYRAITQYMLGFYPDYENVVIKPCIPSDWKECSIKRSFRGDTYLVTISNPNGAQTGVTKLVVDGKVIEGNSFKTFCDGKEHTVEVTM